MVGSIRTRWTPGSGSVTASATEIDQQGANNQVFLGDVSATLIHHVLPGCLHRLRWRRIRQATNTTVFFGPLGLFSPSYTITGGGSGNTYLDAGGNSGVTVDPVFDS